MPQFRATIRYGQPARYDVEDVTAADLAEAMRALADRFPAEVREGADLIEIRVQANPGSRDYTPG